MSAKIVGMDGKPRDKTHPRASPSIKTVISDVVQLNNSGRLKCALVTMIHEDGSIQHSFGTTGANSIEIVGALECAKNFYLNRCVDI